MTVSVTPMGDDRGNDSLKDGLGIPVFCLDDDRAKLLAGVRAGDRYARGAAIMVVAIDARRRGILENVVFQQLWVAVRRHEIPRLIRAAQRGDEIAAQFLHWVYRKLDPTAAPWDDIPYPMENDPWRHLPLLPAGIDIAALQLGLQRIWAEATERALASV